VAGLIGGQALDALLPGAGTATLTAAYASYRAPIYVHRQKQIEALLLEESKPRTQLAATLAGIGSSTVPFNIASVAMLAEVQPRFLPLGAVEEEFRELRQNHLASEWARENLRVVRERLENPNLIGKKEVIIRDVRKFVPQFGLEHGIAEQFYDRFSINKAEELAPLREAFEKYLHDINIMQGKQGPDRMKETDFYRLFFEAASGKYVVREWPPTIEVRPLDDPGAPPKLVPLFETVPKPFLYWKTDELPSRWPDSLDQVQERVLQAWKLQKAREQALPAAEKLARVVVENPLKARQLMRDEAGKLGSKVIILKDVAPLVPTVSGQVIDYVDYSLPKATFVHPRDDMTKQLLALIDLQKPLQAGFSQLDDINTKLFDLRKDKREKVQILTNKPQTIFYVGVMVSPSKTLDEEMRDFVSAYQKSVPGFTTDRFADLAQIETGKEYRRALRDQLREELGVKIEADEETRKSFDSTTN
jgi:hypothetical protein